MFNYLFFSLVKRLLHNNLSKCIYPGTTQILLTINFNIKALIPWTINTTTTGQDLAIAIAIALTTNWSMSEQGHDPHLALNATQVHKWSYQTSSYSICTKCLGSISASMFQRGRNFSTL